MCTRAYMYGFVHSCEVCACGEAIVYTCMYMYSHEVCVYKCLYACICTHSKVCVYMCVYVYSDVRAQVHVCIGMHLAAKGLRARAYVCGSVHSSEECVCTSVCIYI